MDIHPGVAADQMPVVSFAILQLHQLETENRAPKIRVRFVLRGLGFMTTNSPSDDSGRFSAEIAATGMEIGGILSMVSVSVTIPTYHSLFFNRFYS